MMKQLIHYRKKSPRKNIFLNLQKQFDNLYEWKKKEEDTERKIYVKQEFQSEFFGIARFCVNLSNNLINLSKVKSSFDASAFGNGLKTF
jgi:hypothetical protein